MQKVQTISVTGKTNRLVGISIFFAVIIVLQSFTTFVRPGLIPVTLALPPIIIGAALYGWKVGALLGTAFGTVVMLSGITGVAPLSTYMFAANPTLMVLVTLGRGAAVGLAAGLVYKLLSKENIYFAVMAAAVTAPIVNTSIFITVMIAFFRSWLIERDIGTTFFQVFAVLAGINFSFELVVNIVLAPVIVRLITMFKKSSH
jgi:uncharacterized membrane protein